MAKAAQLALGTQAVAVTGTSASLAAGELDEAVALARLIGIRHEVLPTEEFADPAYLANAPDRCYHCKTELYTQLEGVAERFGVAAVLNGANLDDRGDYRPGMTAAAEHRVRSPFIGVRADEGDVRQLAAYWGLPVWDKPASPCLSSRIAYGEAVTPERVAMVDQAEQLLRGLGLRELRVRYHKGDLARLEVPLEALPRLAQPETRQATGRATQAIGLQVRDARPGRFSLGSLNQVLPLESLRVLG